MTPLAQTKPKHIHKFKRHRYPNGNTIYFCTDPDCSFKQKPALLLGKRSLCNRCGEPFILTEYAIRLANPHCERCHNPKVREAVNETNVLTTANDNSTTPVEDIKARFAGVLDKFRGQADEGEI